MKRTSPSLSVDSTAARSPARSIAGPLVIRNGYPAALLRAAQHQAQLLADTRLPDELIEPLGAQRALDRPLVGLRERRHHAVGTNVHIPTIRTPTVHNPAV